MQTTFPELTAAQELTMYMSALNLRLRLINWESTDLSQGKEQKQQFFTPWLAALEVAHTPPLSPPECHQQHRPGRGTSVQDDSQDQRP